MNSVQPRQCVRILTLQLAVPDAADPDSVADEITELLTFNGVCRDGSHLLDWCYLTQYQPAVTAGDDPEEGEVFGLLDFDLTINPKE